MIDLDKDEQFCRDRAKEIIHLSEKLGQAQARVDVLEKALKSTKALNLHLYEEGTVGNRVYNEIKQALND